MYIIYFIILSCAYAITYVDTYFKQPFEIQYSTPGSYILSPKDYKYAPTIFVPIYGAGGGTDSKIVSNGGCTGQNGAYLSVLLDTRSGTASFNIITGRGGFGGRQNITGCDLSRQPIIKMKIPTNGGDSSIMPLDGKIWAVAKGGTRAETFDNRENGNIRPQFLSCRRFGGEKGGYTNISFGYGIVSLERQNGEDSYFKIYSYPILDPGHGGWGSSTFNVNFTPCAVNYQLWKGGSGSDGLVRVIPVAVPINILSESVDIQSVDINFYMHNQRR